MRTKTTLIPEGMPTMRRNHHSMEVPRTLIEVIPVLRLLHLRPHIIFDHHLETVVICIIPHPPQPISGIHGLPSGGNGLTSKRTSLRRYSKNIRNSQPIWFQMPNKNRSYPQQTICTIKKTNGNMCIIMVFRTLPRKT